MNAQIEKLMADLGIRYDQAHRMVRQREEYNRRPRSGVSNWLK